ncbi:183_t:CDS:2 [Ambispora gerdemannii]|uniref:183_t:CDS:1 n=1 Tax=Ambispora gerdemannii TaxID=144530 RepID=A0A9N9G6P0_9GLOM|nr:183_t:CDS:2 [Ambispora gerdemannii]
MAQKPEPPRFNSDFYKPSFLYIYPTACQLKLDDTKIQNKKLPVNPLATHLINQRTGRDNILIPGSALLLDDYKKLTLDDLRFLLKEPFDIEEEKIAVKKMNDVLKDLKSHGVKHSIIFT